MAEAADDLRYPVGRFAPPAHMGGAEREGFVAEIERAPAELRRALHGLGETQLESAYRPGGWSVRQVAHHLPDSHLNGYVRFKLALTEDEPILKTYEEQRWAELEDARTLPVEVSLQLLEGLHARWVRLLRGLDDAGFARTMRHPQLGSDNARANPALAAACVRREPGYGLLRLDSLLALYAWHGRHHVGHVTALRRRMGW